MITPRLDDQNSSLAYPDGYFLFPKWCLPGQSLGNPIWSLSIYPDLWLHLQKVMLLTGHWNNHWKTEHNKLATGTAEAEGKSLNKTVGKYHPPHFLMYSLKQFPSTGNAEPWCAILYKVLWTQGCVREGKEKSPQLSVTVFHVEVLSPSIAQILRHLRHWGRIKWRCHHEGIWHQCTPGYLKSNRIWFCAYPIKFTVG